MQLCFLCNISLFLSWDICFFSHYLFGIYVGVLLIPCFSQPKYKLDLFEGSSLSKRLFFSANFSSTCNCSRQYKIYFWLLTEITHFQASDLIVCLVLGNWYVVLYWRWVQGFHTFYLLCWQNSVHVSGSLHHPPEG